jgi:hypothetical protein
VTAPAVLGTDRLELGEGIRWTAGRAVLTDILAGRLLAVPVESDVPFTPLALLPCPLGAVAPVEGSPGHWIAAAGTGICCIDPASGVEWIARPKTAHPRRCG